MSAHMSTGVDVVVGAAAARGMAAVDPRWPDGHGWVCLGMSPDVCLDMVETHTCEHVHECSGCIWRGAACVVMCALSVQRSCMQVHAYAGTGVGLCVDMCIYVHPWAACR